MLHKANGSIARGSGMSGSTLTEFDVGDGVIWDGRANPLEVVGTSFGSHLMVKGPRGAVYRVIPDPRAGEAPYRLEYRGEPVTGLRRVERELSP